MKPITINHKIYGQHTIHEPVLIELIKSKSLQRLKEVDNNGPHVYHYTSPGKFSRYNHSIGVMLLLRKFTILFILSVTSLHLTLLGLPLPLRRRSISAIYLYIGQIKLLSSSTVVSLTYGSGLYFLVWQVLRVSSKVFTIAPFKKGSIKLQNTNTGDPS